MYIGDPHRDRLGLGMRVWEQGKREQVCDRQLELACILPGQACILLERVCKLLERVCKLLVQGGTLAGQVYMRELGEVVGELWGLHMALEWEPVLVQHMEQEQQLEERSYPVGLGQDLRVKD